MKRGRASSKNRRKIAACIRYAGLVFVVVGVGYLVIQKSTPVARRESPVGAMLAIQRPTIALLNDSSATVLSSNGSSTRLTREEFENRFGIETHSLEGANAANGAVVLYDRILRSPDRNLIAKVSAPKADGASVALIGDHIVVLRSGGRPLRDARIHGWSGENGLFVSALVTSTRAVYEVERSGSVRMLATLPENVLFLEARRGAMWYITASSGEGIESEPIPPSELHRITVLHGDELVVRTAARLVVIGVGGPRNDVAYLTNDGQAIYRKIGDDASNVALGKRYPLLFLDDGRLVMRDGFELLVVDPVTGRTASRGNIPEGNVEVYELKQMP
ncbi:MAG: hypothetical protein AAB879_03320 [Patescibacteria group bacterium]